MPSLKEIVSQLGTVKELFALLWTEKHWWLIPIVVVLCLIGFLIILGEHSAIAPYIYVLF